MEKYDKSTLRILLELNKRPDGCRAIHLSETLNLAKYEISKKLSLLAEEDMIYRTENKDVVLTEKGKAYSSAFARRIDLVVSHLGYEGMDYENAMLNSLEIAMHCNEAYFEKFEKPMTEIIRIKELFADKQSFSGAELARCMNMGSYSFPFVLYRERVKNHDNLSMANKGFENPCEMVIDKDGGSVVLRIKEMMEHSGMTGKLLAGHVLGIEYFDGRDYRLAKEGGQFAAIPLSAFEFRNISSRDRFNNMLLGSVELKVRCTVGIIHMPESKCILSVFMH